MQGKGQRAKDKGTKNQHEPVSPFPLTKTKTMFNYFHRIYVHHV